MDLEEQLDQLYGLPVGEFVAERDALARRLRDEGRRDDATHVRELRKPTVAAWAVNRLARERPKDVAALLDAVDDLQAAQAQAVKGDPARFRDAVEAHRLVLERLLGAAEEALEATGSASAATVERVRETLHAASLEEQGRAALRAGRLERERQSGGLSALGLAGAGPAQDGRARTAGRRRAGG